jgi:hypothetical protein
MSGPNSRRTDVSGILRLCRGIASPIGDHGDYWAHLGFFRHADILVRRSLTCLPSQTRLSPLRLTARPWQPRSIAVLIP